MSTEFASAGLTAGQLNAIVKKLGGHDMALRFLRDELSVSEPTRSWREENGVIYFSVTSDGTTGEDWIGRLEGKGFHIRNYYMKGGDWIGRCEGDGLQIRNYRIVEQVLRLPDFKPTSGVTTEVAVLKSMLFKDSDRITGNIRAEASKRKLTEPNAELACLIREKFADKEIEAMGLWRIVAMHKPIKHSFGPLLMGAHRYGDGCWLGMYYDKLDDGWDRDGGFAFAVSQVSSQS